MTPTQTNTLPLPSLRRGAFLVIPTALITALLTLGGSMVHDRIRTEHTTTESSVRVERLEKTTEDQWRRIGESATKGDLNQAVDSINRRLDDLRDIMLQDRVRKR